MNSFLRYSFFLILFPSLIFALTAGIGKTNLTPPIGTPSAGYLERKGRGMEGVNDPLEAIALFLDNGEKSLVLCSVDHLGFPYEFVKKIRERVQAHPDLINCEIYIGSSHTHSGGGAYLNIPGLGESLAGIYNPKIAQFYIDQTCEAILKAYDRRGPAKIGIGYGVTENLGKYRCIWPKDVTPLSDLTVIKVTHLNDAPLAVLFNYPLHPTVLTGKNLMFSADFVGYTRRDLQDSLGAQPIYFNGALGELIPVIFNEEDRFESCKLLAKSLAASVKEVWDATGTSSSLEINTEKERYAFTPQATPSGFRLHADQYETEINAIVLNKSHAFITIPGELSCLYDMRLKEKASELGFKHLSIFGLTNDTHGYIILPESWRHKTFESHLSFGGENYGEETERRVEKLLKDLNPMRN
jgi:hypothetical protein